MINDHGGDLYLCRMGSYQKNLVWTRWRGDMKHSCLAGGVPATSPRLLLVQAQRCFSMGTPSWHLPWSPQVVTQPKALTL